MLCPSVIIYSRYILSIKGADGSPRGDACSVCVVFKRGFFQADVQAHRFAEQTLIPDDPFFMRPCDFLPTKCRPCKQYGVRTSPCFGNGMSQATTGAPFKATTQQLRVGSPAWCRCGFRMWYANSHCRYSSHHTIKWYTSCCLINLATITCCGELLYPLRISYCVSSEHRTTMLG